MPGASKRVRRLEKAAILRSKECEYTREQSDNLLSSLNLDVEDDDAERRRRHITTRPIRQLQRDIEYPAESLDKISERIQQDIKKKQLTTSTSTPRNYNTSLSSSSVDDRASRDSGNAGKYTSYKHTSSAKLH